MSKRKFVISQKKIRICTFSTNPERVLFPALEAGGAIRPVIGLYSVVL